MFQALTHLVNGMKSRGDNEDTPPRYLAGKLKPYINPEDPQGFTVKKAEVKKMSHLEKVGQTYLQHMSNALCMALRLATLVPVVIIHAVLPFLFTDYTSVTLMNILSDRLKKQNDKDEQS